MIEHYISHFTTGDVGLFKKSQISWIKDKGPSVETNLGFVESYIDPLKRRAEFEGLVAFVNKKKSKVFNDLVENAEKFIPLLPWGADFESDSFTRPDYTSLDILAMATSGTPLGINIPNFAEIRQEYGFKNVYLGNVYETPKKGKPIANMNEENAALYIEHFEDEMLVKVALHELLGHGSGKNFFQNDKGEYNFDFGKVMNPITNEPVKSFYKPGEDFNNRFKKIKSAYEECRADSVAMYLCC
jgi:dipeptidyl-peptidase-3